MTQPPPTKLAVPLRAEAIPMPDGGAFVYDAHGNYICKASMETAAAICRAVNGGEKMRRILEDIREWAPQGAVLQYDDGDVPLVDACQAALADDGG